MYIILVIIAISFIKPSQSQGTIHDFNGKRYILENAALTWSGAEADCVSRRGHLASIQSDAEANFFNFVASNRQIWLGATKTLNSPPSDDWKWSDDTCWSYTNWNVGEPNNGGGNEDCMATAGGSTSVWNDLNCAASLPYLCELDDCGTANCQIDGGWSSWSWGACDAPCGPGTQIEERSCTNPSVSNGGLSCCGSATGNTQSCEVVPCPVNGGWTAWGTWGACTATCGTGSQERSRTCTNPTPAHGGDPCAGDTSESQDCNTNPCPVNGGWTAWGTWGACTATCGTGSQERSRTCTNPTPAHGGDPCAGDTSEPQDCNTNPCPIHGVWTSWGSWETCSLTCGTGSQNRTRTCTDPAPQHGGDNCAGDASEPQDCNTNPCPVNGNWGQWSNWTECDKPCGVGFQNRSRVCDDPAPAHGGNDCNGTHTNETQMCNFNYCPDMCNQYFKMCGCEDIPVIYDMTLLTTNATYYGIDETDVNVTLNSLGTWDSEAIKLLCKNSQCSDTSLQSAINDIQAEIDRIQISLNTVSLSKKLIRKMIDCKANVWGRRGELYDHYEALCKRKVIVRQVHEDLKIKKNILEKEKKRCADRSWLRQVLENSWSKM
uniref:C-type lectin domain-containing protein n=1 Tax=Clytia hemisphaerica TaxID=252671 RepID=A0A7M5X072_9CNID